MVVVYLARHRTGRIVGWTDDARWVVVCSVAAAVKAMLIAVGRVRPAVSETLR
jgi:hypothetical protein